MVPSRVQVRKTVNETRTKSRLVTEADGYNLSTRRLLNKYLTGKTKLLYPEPKTVFPVDLLEHKDDDVCRPKDDE